MAEREKMVSFMKELSNALISVRPLGGSELFVKRFDDYFADPAYCKAAIQMDHKRYHEAMKESARLRKALRGLEEACENLAAGRPQAAYDAMVEGGQADALYALDVARMAGRAALQEAGR